MMSYVTRDVNQGVGRGCNIQSKIKKPIVFAGALQKFRKTCGLHDLWFNGNLAFDDDDY